MQRVNTINVAPETAAMAMGEVQIAARDGHKVPIGTGLGAQGELTDDPREILKGVLLPFGAHKGSAISMMVELMAGPMVGEGFSFEAAEEDNGDGGPPQGGEFILAIDPKVMGGDNWAEHAEKLFEKLEAIEGIRLPGQRRHKMRKDTGSREVNIELVEKCKANDRQAQMQLYRQYCDGMFCVAMRFLKNTDDAEDVLQDSFIKAFQHEFKALLLSAW